MLMMPFQLRAPSVRKNFRSFCLHTSLHGWQYIVEKRAKKARTSKKGEAHHQLNGAGQKYCDDSCSELTCQWVASHPWLSLFVQRWRNVFWSVIVVLSMVIAGNFLYNNTWVRASNDFLPG